MPLYDFLMENDFAAVLDCLLELAGRDGDMLTDDALFRQHFVQPSWSMLPAPIRVLGHGQVHWDEFCAALRRDALEVRDGLISLKPDFRSRVTELARAHLESLNPIPMTKPVRTTPALIAGRGPRKAKKQSQSISGLANTSADLEVAVGIDLGTTYSLVSYVDDKGKSCTIPNAQGKHLTPSVVFFSPEGAIVGEEAVAALTMHPEDVAECVKRDMGAKVYRKKLHGEYLPPEVVSSFILRSLKADAEKVLGPVTKAVITVPAYFEEKRRRATMDAGRLAGLHVLDIINEPTAAAIAYGCSAGFLDRRLASTQPLKVLVFDLGGGTFDVTIVEIQGEKFKTLATDGDVALGGRDWDEKLVDLVAERFRREYREDPRAHPLSLQELWRSAEAAKRQLTERQQAVIKIKHLGIPFQVEVSRTEFEDVTAALLERTRLTSEIVVRQSGLAWSDIDRVLVVGGATRMPMVLRMLEEVSGKRIEHSRWVDEAVAQGAAHYAELLSPKKKALGKGQRFSITNVNSHSLGIEGTEPKTGKKLNKILIPKNTPLPHAVTKMFKTSRKNQRNVLIRVLEGESQHPDDCTLLGVCTIRDFPADLPPGWPLEVTYAYEANGRLHVSAKLKGHNSSVAAEFAREDAISDRDLALWLRCIERESKERPEKRAK